MASSEQLSPAVQRRRLRTEIRAARQVAGLTQDQVASAMDWSLSKIIRIEGGSVTISTNDIKALLACYQITDEHKIRTLVESARGARQRSWWREYADVANPKYLQYIEYESGAFAMRSFQPLVIPGILQTYEYAQSIQRQFAPYTPAGSADALVELRMRRQELQNVPSHRISSLFSMRP